MTIEGGSEALARSVLDELSTELRRAKLCTTGAAEPVDLAARIHIVLHGESAARIHIEDAITQKTVERDVDVGNLPEDGRALPIAIAADELLRASWVELKLHPSVEEEKKVPAPIRDSIGAATAPPVDLPRELPNQIGVRADLVGFGGGQVEIGGALFIRRDFVRWLTGEFFAYGREGIPKTAPDGTVRAHAFGAGLALDLNAVRSKRFQFSFEAGADVGYVIFDGHARSAATGSSFGGVASIGRLGIVTSVDVSHVRLSASLLGLAPFRSVEAKDGSAVITAVGGPGLSGGIGAGVLF